jgi:hypothetical protein
LTLVHSVPILGTYALEQSVDLLTRSSLFEASRVQATVDTRTSAGTKWGFEFRCGARLWKVHEIVQSQTISITGISVYIVDVSTRGKVDEEWLHGRNAKLCRGRAVLVDNLVVAAVALRCKPSVSAFRIRMEAIERIKAPGEIGSCNAAEHEDFFGDGRSDWIDVSATRMATPAIPESPATPATGGGAHEQPPPAVWDRDPTPPPLLLRNGVVHCNRREESAAREAALDEQTTARLQGLALRLRSKAPAGIDADLPCRTGDTQRIDQAAHSWALSARARAPVCDDTQILDLGELEEALAAAPMVRARAELPHDAEPVTRTQVMIRGRR